MLGYIISDKEEINIKEHEIQSFDILHKTDLNIFVVENNKVLYKNDIIFNACRYGHVKVLEWFKNSGYEFNYNICLIFNVLINGHVQVLELLKNYGYEFKHTKYMINCVSQYGHIHVLEWFKNSGCEFKYSMSAINYAYCYEHVQVLEFFKNRNVKKVIKWSRHKFNKTIKYKTKNNYIKGYNKN